MRNKCFTRLTMVVVMSLFLSGCWDSGDIERQENVSLTLVDFKEEQYHFYVEVANVLGGNNQDNNGVVSYSLLTASGDSLIEARDDANRRSNHTIYLGATRAVIFTQRLAEKGIEEYINRIRGQTNYRKSVLLVTSPTDPIKLMSSKPENNLSVGDAINDALWDLGKEGQSIIVDVGEVLQILALENVGFLIPQMSLEEDEMTLTGYSVFKNSKCMGTIPAEERKGVLYLLLNKPQFYYQIYDGNDHFICTVEMKKKRIKPIFKDGEISFEIDMSFQSKIQYMGKMIKVTKEKQKQLSQQLTQMIEDDIIKVLKDSQETYRCDYLGFYRYFRAEYLSEFKEMNWEDQYAQAEMKVRIDTKIVGEQ